VGPPLESTPSPNPHKNPFQGVSFAVVQDSAVPEFEYCFHVEVSLAVHTHKITAIPLREGRMLNVYKEGLVQILCNYALTSNGLMGNYSLRIHPLTGTVKLTYINHLTDNQIADMFKYPVEFCDKVTTNIQQMAERLNERLLGRILHLTNEVPLQNILPESVEAMGIENAMETAKKVETCNPLYPSGKLTTFLIINNRLKNIRRELANSTIKYSFFSKETNRFFPELVRKK
jgi:hypothetical protein